jgi:hypothetical protein
LEKLDGARLPEVAQNPDELELAARFAPLIHFDRNEPFLPLRVGYTVFRETAPSPSFPRLIELKLENGIQAALAIEYAIWWDWDIQHLYELEHFWAYLGEDEKLIYSEASWHGKYRPATIPGQPPVTAPGTSHTRIYAQPGKHAFLPDPQPFAEHRERVTEPCLVRAGETGLLVTPLFEGILDSRKTLQADLQATEYLKTKAFTPAFRWDKEFLVSQEILIPWPVLFQWIPLRIDWVLAELSV